MQSASMGPVSLSVADLAGASRFYREVLGLRVHRAAAAGAQLGLDGGTLLDLHAAPPAARPAPHAAGLYHVAFLVPSRLDLARVLLRIAGSGGVPLGAADHGVSEALYFADPEGNGIEVYADRPRGRWPVRDGQLAMTGDPLDADGLVALGRPYGAAGLPAGTRIGHIHLQVTDVVRSEAFYARLGFTVTQHWEGAAFLAAGGYHHHLGLNSWRSAGGPAWEPDHLGLMGYRIEVPATADLGVAAARTAVPLTRGALELADPDGIPVLVTASKRSGRAEKGPAGRRTPPRAADGATRCNPWTSHGTQGASAASR